MKRRPRTWWISTLLDIAESVRDSEYEASVQEKSYVHKHCLWKYTDGEINPDFMLRAPSELLGKPTGFHTMCNC